MPVIIQNIIFTEFLWRSSKTVFPKVQVLDAYNTINFILLVISSQICHISNKKGLSADENENKTKQNPELLSTIPNTQAAPELGRIFQTE